MKASLIALLLLALGFAHPMFAGDSCTGDTQDDDTTTQDDSGAGEEQPAPSEHQDE